MTNSITFFVLQSPIVADVLEPGFTWNTITMIGVQDNTWRKHKIKQLSEK